MALALDGRVHGVVGRPAVPAGEDAVAPRRCVVDKRQAASLVVVALLGWTTLAFSIGVVVGARHSWSYLDVATVERRLREVFCEQAIRNRLMKVCDPHFARYQE